MRSDLAELAFFVYFFSGFAFQRNKREQKMQKSITERTLRVMHDNASSEGTRQGWEARHERQSQSISTNFKYQRA